MATTTNYSWTTPDDTDLVKDGASAIRTLGSAIDTTVFNNAGAAIAKSTIDAKGDLLVGTADDTVGRLAVGTDGYTLVADSAESTGLKWAAPAAGGKVLQVVSTTYSTVTLVASTSYTDSGLSLSITPSSATSKILVLVNQNIRLYRETNVARGSVSLLRGATEIIAMSSSGLVIAATGASLVTSDRYYSTAYLDSPNTTSSTTYKTQIRANSTANAGAIYAQADNVVSMMTLLEIGA